MRPLRPVGGVALAFALVIACGPASSAATTTSTTVAGLPDRCEGACTDGERCVNGLDWQCTCTHRADVNCGGAPRPVGPGTWEWACVPTNPPAPAPTDCPATVPLEGTPCTASTRCSYAGPCSWTGMNAHCDGSLWHVDIWMTSPPP